MLSWRSLATCGILFAQGGNGGGGAAPWLLGPWLPIGMVVVLFYLLVMRPERQKRADLARMLENLKKNDRVVTIGGIIGTVVNTSKGSEEITIKVDESNLTKLKVLRSAISRVMPDGETPEG